MIKILGCILILLSSTAAGFIYGNNYKKRVYQLNEIQRSLYQIQNEMEYNHTTLPDIFYNVSRKSKAPIDSLFNEISILLCSNEVDDVYGAFNSVFKNNNSINLNKEDIDLILDLSKSLGECNIEGQKKIFLLAQENLKKQIANAEIKMNKNLKMYRYLGFSIGAMLTIILI